MANISPFHLSAERVQGARQELFVFFVFLIPLSALVYWVMLMYHMPDILLSWTPAVSALLTHLVYRRSLGDVSFRFGGRRTLFAILLALLIPLLICFIAYGTSWISGLTHLVLPDGAIPAGFPQSSQPLVYFMETLFLTLTLVTLVFFVYTAGEEIGWRGFMVTRLVEARVPAPFIVSGLIWGLWHFPDILGGNYPPVAQGAPLVLALTLFLVIATTYGYFLAWLRLSTGSIWPCIVAHSAWNAITQALFNPATRGNRAGLWIGESGILTVFVSLIVIVTVVRLWPLRRMLITPHKPLLTETNPPQEEHKEKRA